MLKDDRMMGMLTFVVIMLAVGTLIQRVDFFEKYFGEGSPPLELNADEASVRATQSARIDVLANDAGLDADAARKLKIVAGPGCGRAFVRGGVVSYLGSQGCVGEQTLRYGLSDNEATGLVRITVRRAREPEAKTSEAPAASGEADATTAQASQPVGRAAEPDAFAKAEDPAAAEGSAGRTRDGGTSARSEQGEASTALARIDPEPGDEDAGTAPEDEPATAPEAGADGEPEPAGATGTDRAEEAQVAASEVDEPDARATGSAPAGAGGAEAGAAATAECTVPPTVTLDLEPAAMTAVMVDSPCHADSVGELAYDGLRFAVPLDAEGSGNLTVPGFQGASDAVLRLEGRDPKAFIIPFRDIERIDRVGVVWEAPAGVALHALEFGAGPGRQGHVSPAAPRSFEAVQRKGGGWLTTYEPAGGRGQRIEVYSFWRSYGGPSGVIRLGLDLGNVRAAGPDGCPGGTVGGADFKVLRAVAGRPAEPQLGRVAPLDCTELAGSPGRLIDEAVEDLIVPR